MILDRRFFPTTMIGVVVITIMIVLSGCWKHEKPNITYMPNMAYSPAVKAQEVSEEGGMFTPVPGTISRDHQSYDYTDPVEAGRALTNPLPRLSAHLRHGQSLFQSFCMPCHGPTGQGDGSVVPHFPRPPSLTTDKINGFRDGQLFHIITVGQGLMPGYAKQVLPEERWAIVHYIRALYRSQNPSDSDVRKAEEGDY